MIQQWGACAAGAGARHLPSLKSESMRRR